MSSVRFKLGPEKTRFKVFAESPSEVDVKYFVDNYIVDNYIGGTVLRSMLIRVPPMKRRFNA